MAPLKLAIIGGGPSSFYVASRLLSILPKSDPLRIHVYDRLWAPHGLVRYGVAPDHPEVKVCLPPPSTHLLTPYTAPPELHAQVRSGRGRFSSALFRECASWATDPPSYPARPHHIPALSKVPLHPPPLLHRLRYPHPTLRPTVRPCHPCALPRPLVHTAPFASRAATFTLDGARLDHRAGQRRAGRCAHATHAARGTGKVRRPSARA